MKKWLLLGLVQLSMADVPSSIGLVTLYDTQTNTFSNGRLLAGLPSNIVNSIDMFCSRLGTKHRQN